MSLTLDTLVAIATLVLVVTGLFLIFGLLHVINLANAGLMAVGVYAELSFRGHGVRLLAEPGPRGDRDRRWSGR